MTEDPVRLLSQESDAFASSLLRAAKDGDRDAARSHKAAVLGAAGGAAVLGAALGAATKLSSRGFFSILGGKWIATVLVTIAGLGAGAALLWPRDAHPPHPALASDVDSPRALEAPNAALPSEAPRSSPSDMASPAATDAPPSQPPSPAADPAGPAATANDPPSKDAPSATPTADSTSARGKLASAGTPHDAKPETPGDASAATPSGASSASPATSGLAEEVAALRAAHEALGRGQSQRCLDAVSAYFAAFPNGRLSAEARYLRVEAMFAGGQRAQAASLASAMLAKSPKSPYAARLRTIAGEAP